jgi:quinol monooxygenase YgiN
MVEFKTKPEFRDSLIKVMNDEIVPLLKKQTGFVDVISMMDETDHTICTTFSLWNTRQDAEKYANESYTKVVDLMKSYLATMPTVRTFTVETSTFHKISGMAA